MAKYLTMEDIEDVKNHIQIQITKHNLNAGGKFELKEYKSWTEATYGIMGQSIFTLRTIEFVVDFKNFNAPISFAFSMVDESRKLYRVTQWSAVHNSGFAKYFKNLVNRYNKVSDNYRPFTKHRPEPITPLEDVKGIEYSAVIPIPDLEDYKEEGLLRELLDLYKEKHPDYKLFNGNVNRIQITLPTVVLENFLLQTKNLSHPSTVRVLSKFAKAVVEQLEENVNQETLGKDNLLKTIEYYLIKSLNQLISTNDTSLQDG